GSLPPLPELLLTKLFGEVRQLLLCSFVALLGCDTRPLISFHHINRSPVALCESMSKVSLAFHIPCLGCLAKPLERLRLILRHPFPVQMRPPHPALRPRHKICTCLSDVLQPIRLGVLQSGHLPRPILLRIQQPHAPTHLELDLPSRLRAVGILPDLLQEGLSIKFGQTAREQQ